MLGDSELLESAGPFLVGLGHCKQIGLVRGSYVTSSQPADEKHLDLVCITTGELPMITLLPSPLGSLLRLPTQQVPCSLSSTIVVAIH